MLEHELETAVRLAREAGNKVLEYYAGEVIAEEKLGADNFSEPVTIADRAASRIVVDGLSEQFPDDFILSEEELDDPGQRTRTDRVWIIDPIDGTWGFLKKDGDFGVQIGLAIAGEPVVGVVYLPAHDRLYYAAKDHGSFLIEDGGSPLRLQVSTNTDFAKMNLAVSRNHRSPKINRIIKELGLNREVQRGSVGLKVGLIAEEVCDLYIHLSPRTKFWDTCGPQIILEEAGGRMTDLFGELIRYGISDVQNHGGIVAANGSAHEMIIERLRPLLNEFGRLKVKASGS
ncbi:MAG TPA: 3'(2'),5'-bisphosphate nucleotidase CysQ [Pyrinomonadaceae bacterium]|nr:3'(2'),5'-bisphosphate nucleotidase CysQ [Pyrinomonadaceae bacterium]